MSRRERHDVGQYPGHADSVQESWHSNRADTSRCTIRAHLRKCHKVRTHWVKNVEPAPDQSSTVPHSSAVILEGRRPRGKVWPRFRRELPAPTQLRSADD